MHYAIVTLHFKKSHVIDSRDAENVFNKIQYPLKIQTLSKLLTEGDFLNLRKGNYGKTYS